MVESSLYTISGRPQEQVVRRENVSFSEPAQLVRRNAQIIFSRRSMGTILGCCLLSLAAAGVYLTLAQPTYTARAQLLIDLKLPQFLQGGNAEPGFALDSSQLESHIVLLQSERVATAVIEKLNLLKDDEFRDKSNFLGRLIGWSPAGEELQAAIERFARRLEVRRIGISYAVAVGFSSQDAAKAAKIANAIVEAYLQSLVDFRAEAARVAVQSDSYTISNVHLVSKALAPIRTSWPKVPLVVALSLAMGAVIGACLAIARDASRTRSDIGLNSSR
jgi:succinoglycan biosynthesis transport protein ExoP